MATPPAATAGTPPVEEAPETSEHAATTLTPTGEPLPPEPRATPGGGVPTWILAAAGVVTAAVVAATAWAWTSAGDDGSDVGEQGVDEAVSVAEEAAVPMLSFDYRDLDQGIVSAESFMTSDYAAKHSLLINDLRDDIVAQQTVVDAQVMGSAVTRTTAEGVDVLVLVNQVTQRATGQPFLLPVWATVQMVEQDGTWRVDNLVNRGAVSEEPSEEAPRTGPRTGLRTGPRPRPRRTPPPSPLRSPVAARWAARPPPRTEVLDQCRRAADDRSHARRCGACSQFVAP